MSSLIRKGSRSPMSRNSLISTRRTRAVWDRTAADTRLLLSSFPYPVSLVNTMNPLRMTLIASAPSRPPSPQRHLAADARVPSPRMITHGSHPQRACPTTVDARVLSRMISRSAFIGVEADACGIAPRMISRSALLGVEADACGIAPRMISRTATLDAEADACANPQMISHVPSQAAEGALANLILTLSPSPFRHSPPLHRGACPPKADHSGLRAGVHPFNISLSSSRVDRPVALGVDAPNGAPTPLSPSTKGPAC